MKTSKIPTLRPHLTGQARATFDGQTVYFGKWGTPEATEKYERHVAEWLLKRRTTTQQTTPAPRLTMQAVLTPTTVNGLLLAYLEYALVEYGQRRSARGSMHRIRRAIRSVRKLYGTTPAAAFDVQCLAMVRESMIRDDLGRSYIRDLVNITRDVFRWGAEKKLVPGSVWTELLAMKHLSAGSGRAREPRKVRPVDASRVRAVRRFLSRQVRAVLALQKLTGARPGELCIMRSGDIDRTGDVWAYAPQFHKTMHLDCDRQIPLGPRARRIIRQFLPRADDAYLFSPAEAEAERRAASTTSGKGAKKRKMNPKRKPGNHYTTQSYRTAIQRACDRAFPAAASLDDLALKAWRKRHRWFPYQVRHGRATEVAEQFGGDVAKVMLGHRSQRTTEGYVHRSLKSIADAVRKIG